MGNKTISTALTVLAIIVLAAPVTFGTFAVLRVCHVISWSWWIVTLLLWATALILLSVTVAVMLIMFAARSLMAGGAFGNEMRAKRGARP